MTKSHFERLLAKARKSMELADEQRTECRIRYGNDRWMWPRKDQRRYEVLNDRQDRDCDRAFNALKSVSPRDWEHTVPYYWVIENVTWEMALSNGQIPVPPPCYGGSHAEAERWASPLTASICG